LAADDSWGSVPIDVLLGNVTDSGTCACGALAAESVGADT